jgi:hypothetical protein
MEREIGGYALPVDKRVAEGSTHPGCASQNLTFETPPLPQIGCLAQRVKQWRDLRGDPLPDERCRIHERKHGLSIAPVARIRSLSADMALCSVSAGGSGGCQPTGIRSTNMSPKATARSSIATRRVDVSSQAMPW